METCKICSKKYKDLCNLQKHIKISHKEILIEDYYDRNISRKNKQKCVFCGKDCSFIGFTKGYKKICKSKECLSKSRATYTIEYGMKMEGLTEIEAKKRLENFNKTRVKTFKKTTKDIIKENPNFNKEKSHQCVEYWIKRGYNEEEAKEKVAGVLENLHKKTWDKRRENPEMYKDVNTTQLEYWIKKGYSMEEANEKRRERQRTFTLDKCIEKYGKEEGQYIYYERHRKWSEKMDDKFIERDFNRYPGSISEFEKDIIDKISMNVNEKYVSRQFKIKMNKAYSVDFKYKNKLIEFFGDYWHCNPKTYESNFFNKNKKKYASEIWEYDKRKIEELKSKYDVLIIWESEYKENKEKILEKCNKFLNDE